jgi:hypothetical protein
MESFEHLLYQLHLSYLQARKNERNTHNQLKFEMYQEEGLMQLAKAIYQRKYIQIVRLLLRVAKDLKIIGIKGHVALNVQAVSK